MCFLLFTDKEQKPEATWPGGAHTSALLSMTTKAQVFQLLNTFHYPIILSKATCWERKDIVTFVKLHIPGEAGQLLKGHSKVRWALLS